MKLYHSSDIAVTSPDVIHSRDYLDFGKRVLFDFYPGTGSKICPMIG